MKKREKKLRAKTQLEEEEKQKRKKERKRNRRKKKEEESIRSDLVGYTNVPQIPEGMSSNICW